MTWHDFQDEHLQQEPRQEEGEERSGVERADHPRKEKAGHLEVSICKQQVVSQNLFASAVELVTMVFLVLVATFAWLNGLTKSIADFAQEN